LEEALKYAIKEAKVNTLCLTARGIFINKTTGHICLEAVESHYDTNKCIFVTLDLIDGHINIVENACIYT
jgi:hypothetical protein